MKAESLWPRDWSARAVIVIVLGLIVYAVLKDRGSHLDQMTPKERDAYRLERQAEREVHP